MTEFENKLRYVYWFKEAKKINITISESIDKIRYLEKHGTLAESKNQRKEWSKPLTYRLDQNGYWRFLYVNEKKTEYEKGKYVIYSWHEFDDGKNTGGPRMFVGHDAAKAVSDLFRKNNDGKTLQGAFGYSEGHEIRKCVPRQFYYIKETRKHQNLKRCNKADYSSHFPASIRGRLPSFRSCDIKRCKGMKEPNENYPFAFYIRSGHSCELGVYDTRTWKDQPLGKSLLYDFENRPFFRNVPPSEEETILCRASEYTLDKEMEFFYNKRKEDEVAKVVMNACIGYWHPKSNRTSFRLFHLAAVAIARANQKVLDLVKEIGEINVLMIIVDSIIYYGDRTFGEKEKKLGSLHKEITGMHFRMRGMNQYAFADPKTGEIPQPIDKPYVCHAGVDANIEETFRLEDIEKWDVSEETKSRISEGQMLAKKKVEEW